MVFKIDVAGVVVCIDSIYPSIFYRCGKYLVPNTEAEKISICTNKKEVIREQMILSTSGSMNLGLPSIEEMIVHRKFVESMLCFDAFLIHGVAIAIDRQGCLFVAKSGTGKTTHAMCWMRNNRDVYVVNGDKPLIRVVNDEVFVCGTPWCGKENLSTNVMVKLKAIIVMERDTKNVIEIMPNKRVFQTVLSYVYCPDDIEKKKGTMQLLNNVLRTTPVYHFRFNNFAEDAYSVAYEALFHESM